MKYGFMRYVASVASVALLAMLFGLLGGSVGAAVVEGSSDIGDNGWVVTGDAQNQTGALTYHAANGNPGGCLLAGDDVSGGVWCGNALSCELCQIIFDETFDTTDNCIMEDRFTLVYDASPNPPKSWTPYTVVLTETAEWTFDTRGDLDPAPSQMQGVLDDMSDLWIRGEVHTGQDMVGNPGNVMLAPERMQ